MHDTDWGKMRKRRREEKRNQELAPLQLDPDALDDVLHRSKKRLAHEHRSFYFGWRFATIQKVEKERNGYRFDWRWYGTAALLSLFCLLSAPPNPIAWIGLLGGCLSVMININLGIRLIKRA
jgi:hypothetical protein